MGPYEVTVSVLGYELAAEPPMLLPPNADEVDPALKARLQEGNRQVLKSLNTTEVRVDRDVNDLVITLSPAAKKPLP
jgi:hypothetical protein